MALVRGSHNRDLRVDFFRGLALWWIYTDHIPGDILSNVSLQNFALCDAAEVFVLLAGFGAGKAYALRMDRSGWLRGSAGALQRAWTLYIAHIFLFVVYAAQVSYSAAALARGNYLEESGLNVLANAPYTALIQRPYPPIPAQSAQHPAALHRAAGVLRVRHAPTAQTQGAGDPLLRNLRRRTRRSREPPFLDRRRLVLQPAHLAAAVHDRRHPGL